MALPPRLEKVAEAGGWEERAKQKAQEELINKMGKIPTEKWKSMLDTVISVENIVDKGGFDLSLIEGWKDELKKTFETELEYIVSPFLNEITALINATLEPFMPAIQIVLGSLTELIQRGFGLIEALIEGKLDEFLYDLKVEAQQAGALSWWDTPAQHVTAIANFERNFPHIDLTALSAQGTAGGVYSGQFDITPEESEKIIEQKRIGGFTG